MANYQSARVATVADINTTRRWWERAPAGGGFRRPPRHHLQLLRQVVARRRADGRRSQRRLHSVPTAWTWPIISFARRSASFPPPARPALGPIPSPRQINEFLDAYVVGQPLCQEGRLSVAVHNHYKRTEPPPPRTPTITQRRIHRPPTTLKSTRATSCSSARPG